MYQLTIFEASGEVDSVTLHDEYPTNVDLRPGAWVDICRIKLSDVLFLEHLLEDPCFENHCFA